MRVPRCKSRSARLALVPQSRNRKFPALHARTAGIVLVSGRVGEWGERGWIGHVCVTQAGGCTVMVNTRRTQWSFGGCQSSVVGGLSPGIEAAQVCRHASAHFHVHSAQYCVYVSRRPSRVCLVASSAFWCQVLRLLKKRTPAAEMELLTVQSIKVAIRNWLDGAGHTRIT
jgi:hypothetical protein